MRGYFEIGVYHAKTPINVGTLWRSAYQLGAAGIFVVGRRYHKQSSDTLNTTVHLPLREFSVFENFYETLPKGAQLIAVELGGTPLATFPHPHQAVYLLGAEDHGLPPQVLNRCHQLVSIESVRTESYNVAVAGSLVMYHRYLQHNTEGRGVR